MICLEQKDIEQKERYDMFGTEGDRVKGEENKVEIGLNILKFSIFQSASILLWSPLLDFSSSKHKGWTFLSKIGRAHV